MVEAYDPLHYENLARSVVNALLEAAAVAMPPASEFSGSGVYALYYLGGLPFYEGIASRECHTPIYVGKAAPAGGRKGGRTSGTDGGSGELFRRLRQHGRSVEQARNLHLSEFRCRYLVVVPVWIDLAERFLLEHYRPVWNTVIDGFGNHDPGRGRRAMRRPRWDVVHPGRPWAEALQTDETVEDVLALLD